MNKNKILEQLRAVKPEYIDIFVDNSYDLAERIYFLMQERNIDQKQLAKLLGKSESEISKWLSGTHNFTFKTAAKIESALKGKLFDICKNRFNEKEGVLVMKYQTATFDTNFFIDLDFGTELSNIEEYSEETVQNYSSISQEFTTIETIIN